MLVLTLAIGYLLGSVPCALWVARAHGVDLRRTSDGNPGAWNALEQLGWRRALPAFLGDGLKGSLAGAAGLLLAGVTGAYLGVAAAMLGHAFPAFARLRGGKAVMTWAGGMFVLAPVAAFTALAICGIVSVAARRFAIGVRVAVVAVVPLQALTQPIGRVAATGALMTLIGALFLVRSGDRATSPTA